MKDGFLKAAALSPALRVADCAYNTRQILTELRAAAARGVKLAVFPEFCLTGYTCGDLFLQRTLQQGALTGLQELLDASRELDTVAALPCSAAGSCWVWFPKRTCPTTASSMKSGSSPPVPPRWSG